jgi:hypothetical protein
MEDNEILELFVAAWAGLDHKFAQDPDKRNRVRDTYCYRLRSTSAEANLRGLLAELLAEGLIAKRGPSWWYKERSVFEFWVTLSADPIRVRTLAITAMAA